MDKLAEIKGALAACDAAHKKANEYFVKIAKDGRYAGDVEYNIGKLIIQPATDNLHRVSYDYLRLLLPIVEAADEYKAACTNDGSSDAIQRWMSNLFDALKTLE